MQGRLHHIDPSEAALDRAEHSKRDVCGLLGCSRLSVVDGLFGSFATCDHRGYQVFSMCKTCKSHASQMQEYQD